MASGQATQSKYVINNVEYNLVATLHNLQQGVQALSTYIEDAHQMGDQECARLFQNLQRQYTDQATEVREHLQRHLSSKATSKNGR